MTAILLNDIADRGRRADRQRRRRAIRRGRSDGRIEAFQPVGTGVGQLHIIERQRRGHDAIVGHIDHAGVDVVRRGRNGGDLLPLQVDRRGIAVCRREDDLVANEGLGVTRHDVLIQNGRHGIQPHIVKIRLNGCGIAENRQANGKIPADRRSGGIGYRIVLPGILRGRKPATGNQYRAGIIGAVDEGNNSRRVNPIFAGSNRHSQRISVVGNHWTHILINAARVGGIEHVDE